MIEHMFEIAPTPVAVDDQPAWLPGHVDHMPPGPVLAATLSAIEVDELSGHDRIRLLRAQQRMASHYTAGVSAAMASVADYMEEYEDDDPQFALEAAAAEIRAALRLTRRAADSELSFALDLNRRLPKVWNAMAAGDIDVRRAKTIVYRTTHLTDDTAREVVDRIIDHAPRLTTGQLAARIRRLCIEADTDEAERRYDDAVAERRIVVEPNDTGTANLLGLDLPPDSVAAASRHVDHLARSLKTGDEARSMDQLRADVFLDLLSGRNLDRGGRGPHRKGLVDIRVDLTTLAGLTETPGELAGYGPVIADIARQVTEEQNANQSGAGPSPTPTQSMPLPPAPPGAAPPPSSAARSRPANPTCIFPGCRMPATGSDLDHHTPTRRRRTHGSRQPRPPLPPRPPLRTCCRMARTTPLRPATTNGRQGWATRTPRAAIHLEVVFAPTPPGVGYTADHHEERSQDICPEPTEDGAGPPRRRHRHGRRRALLPRHHEAGVRTAGFAREGQPGPAAEPRRDLRDARRRGRPIRSRSSTS